MKVVIDISPLRSGHKTRGIGIYTRRLVEALKKVDKDNSYYLTSSPNEIGADLVHFPYFDFFFPTLHVNRGLPAVVTIHDTIPLVFPHQYKPGLRGRLAFWRQKRALTKAAAIVTDSDNSKTDIVKFLSQPPDKVTRVYLAADEEFRPASKSEVDRIVKKYQLPEKFCLYVGDINYNKNLLRLIEALERLPNELSLVLVAGALRNKSTVEAKKIFELIEAKNLTKRVKILTNVPFGQLEDLRAIYSAAGAYVQPSLYEGFGLPVLEAMACGVPVVISKTSSLTEIGGGASVYVKPLSVDSIADGIKEVFSWSKSKRDKTSNLNIEWSRKFSWEETARETIRVYEKVLAQ